MKRLLSFIFLFAWVISACAPVSPTAEAAAKPTEAATTAPTEEAVTPTEEAQVATLAENTPAVATVELRVVSAPQLSFIRMLDGSNGWGVTDDSVVRTEDGGKTWLDITPAGATTLGYGTAGSFLSQALAFVLVGDPTNPAANATLYRTSDGGVSWTFNQVSFGSGDLRFLDEENGWIMVNLGVAAGSNAVSVYQTGDGGETWKRMFTNDPTVDGAADSLPLGGLKNALVPLDMKTAWVSGVIYAPDTLYLYRTDDGGGDWSQVIVDLSEKATGSELSITAFQLVSPKAGYVAVNYYEDTLQTMLYVTRDGGQTWTLTPTNILNGSAVDFVSDADGFIFDGEGFQVTHDAGSTWSSVKPDVSFTDSFMSMDFVSPQVGWVLAMDSSTSAIQLYRTEDGGQTWSLLSE